MTDRQYRKMMFSFLSKLEPGQVFIKQFKYFYPSKPGKLNKLAEHEYSLMRRTDARVLNTSDYTHHYVSDEIEMTKDNIEAFYENYFGVWSGKSFKTLDDPELNMLTSINFGKSARELLIV